jgi:hypothetical protein
MKVLNLCICVEEYRVWKIPLTWINDNKRSKRKTKRSKLHTLSKTFRNEAMKIHDREHRVTSIDGVERNLGENFSVDFERIFKTNFKTFR